MDAHTHTRAKYLSHIHAHINTDAAYTRHL